MTEVARTKWVAFEEGKPTPSGKTKRFTVWSVAGEDYLGAIKWHAAWRQYCFFPGSNTIWNTECLDDVTAFVRSENQKHKQALALEKAFADQTVYIQNPVPHEVD